MRVCTAAQMSAIDKDTIAGGVQGLELMERAGEAMTQVLLDFMATLSEDNHEHDHSHHEEQDCGCTSDTCEIGEDPKNILVLVGKGNNGGDGLVIARLLYREGLGVTVMLLAEIDSLSPESSVNLNRLPTEVQVVSSAQDDWVEIFQELVDGADMLVDAVFGTGITPPLRMAHTDLFRAVNDSGISTFAVDIPSGVSGDDGQVDPVAIAADITATVSMPKYGLLLPPGRDFAGELEVVDIGFPEDICRKHSSNHHWLGREEYLAMLPPRSSSVHKYDCGNLLIAAGSRAFGGAAQLTALGALRSGVGLVNMAVPISLETSLRVACPEAILAPLAETEAGTMAAVANEAMEQLLYGKQALAVGCGLGSDPETDGWVVDTLPKLDLSLVVDADGLSAFARQGVEPSFNSSEVVLTPHAGEMARLLGLKSNEVNELRFDLVAEYAAKWNVVLMLKGSPTIIGTPDGQVFINPTGDDSLARAGSGDVLCGLVGGLLAQGLPAFEAALLGAYVHGLAGSLAAETIGSRSVRTVEVPGAIGPVFMAMEKEASLFAELREKIWPVK